MQLGHVRVGTTCTIKDYSKTHHLVRRRLLDLGLKEGSRVRIYQKMPFGGPVVIQGAGQFVGIRYADAGTIEVEGCS
ncbi:MAG: ferrous iron transport protein A [Bacillaceae bacterium]|nr:ferrous iron transport protein A [Bacillaceae bacterium]